MEDEALIVCVQDYPNIYDLSHPKYHDKNVKLNCWKEIGERLNQPEPGPDWSISWPIGGRPRSQQVTPPVKHAPTGRDNLSRCSCTRASVVRLSRRKNKAREFPALANVLPKGVRSHTSVFISNGHHPIYNVYTIWQT
ncbi:hypothetical protein J6590_054312 [Homalodisca vitripennis]|nr:hypothetical protein J6590_054312 [Homalodisca vitripennis]